MSARIAALSCGLVLAIGLPMVIAKNAQHDSGVATTADAQQFDVLWRDLEALQKDSAQLGAAAFKQRVVARTIEYLEFGVDQATRYAEAVDRALVDLHDARMRMQKVNATESAAARRDGWSKWQAEQRAAADQLIDSISATPRHRLLADRRLLWLLRLEYGIRASATGG